MAKGTLSFNLPEEQVEFEMACKALDFNCVLDEFDNELRNHLKYDSHPHWDSQTVEEIRTILNSLMQERCLHFN